MNRDVRRYALLLGVALGVKLLLDVLPDEVLRWVFQLLPARIAAGYWSAPLDPTTLTFKTHGVTLEVTRTCAATDFCAMVFALLVFSRFRWFSPVLAWGVTLGANAIRLVLLVPVDALFPKESAPAMHLGAGVVVFLPILFAVWLLTQRKEFSNER